MGSSLIREAKALQPTLRTLISHQQPIYRTLPAAVKAGTGGICADRMTRSGSFHGALHVLIHDGS